MAISTKDSASLLLNDLNVEGETFFFLYSNPFEKDCTKVWPIIKSSILADEVHRRLALASGVFVIMRTQSCLILILDKL